MAFIEAPTTFYLGRMFDPQSREMTDDVLYYDSRDLTTHAMVVGMTGSGKTGLCISLLEEAILDNIPALIVDPKGDITNLDLTFPDLRPGDFEPWVQPDDARRAGMDMSEYVQDLAHDWREGLANWGIVPQRLSWLKGAGDVNIYTPGSDSGLPVSILASLRAPRLDWQMHGEGIRERISGIVTAIFTLAGMNVEPVKDPEHVLLSNIIETNWQRGLDMTLEDIILQIQNPPFDKLGVFPLEQFMEEKKRYKLAMELNNIIASPSFQNWLQGEPLDIQRLMYRPDGKPRVSIFYTAHLNDQERQFFTTLLLESLIGWMRTQPGTTSLRGILYIDEIYGYFPPYPLNPPTKEPLMRLLKQARAYGIGLILATQNPGDLDYKGLTNMGTWFIGRLQSANDRKKIMSGLKAMVSAEENMNLDEVEQLVSDLQPRVFLMRNVHHMGGPELFHTRWAMNFLAGPLTRAQISLLMAGKRQDLMMRTGAMQYGMNGGDGQFAASQPLQQRFQQPQAATYDAQGMPPPNGFRAGMPPPPPGFPRQPSSSYSAQAVAPARSAVAPSQPINGFQAQAAADAVPGYTSNPPSIPGDIDQYFLPSVINVAQAMTQQFGGVVGAGDTRTAYRPVLLAQVSVRYQQKKASIYTARHYAFHVPDVQMQGIIHWEDYQAPVVDTRHVLTDVGRNVLYADLPPGLSDPSRLKTLQRELTDMIYNTARLVIPYQPTFKIYGHPDRQLNEFKSQVYQLARESRDADIDKLNDKYAKLMDKLEDGIRRKERDLDAERTEMKDLQREQLYTGGEAIISIFKGRTNYTLSRLGRVTRYKRQAQADLSESQEVINEMYADIEKLERDYEQELQALNDRWARETNVTEDEVLTPFKKDIQVEMFGIGWLPQYVTVVNGQPTVVSAI